MDNPPFLTEMMMTSFTSFTGFTGSQHSSAQSPPPGIHADVDGIIIIIISVKKKGLSVP